MVSGWVVLPIGFFGYLWFFYDDTVPIDYYSQRERLKAAGKKVS
jgi:hypothetical protein